MRWRAVASPPTCTSCTSGAAHPPKNTVQLPRPGRQACAYRGFGGFLSRLCEYEPETVHRYLSTTSSYRLGYCLELCQRYTVVDATAYLLERVGDASGSLELLLSADWLGAKLQTFEYAAETAVTAAAVQGGRPSL